MFERVVCVYVCVVVDCWFGPTNISLSKNSTRSSLPIVRLLCLICRFRYPSLFLLLCFWSSFLHYSSADINYMLQKSADCPHSFPLCFYCSLSLQLSFFGPQACACHRCHSGWWADCGYVACFCEDASWCRWQIACHEAAVGRSENCCHSCFIHTLWFKDSRACCSVYFRSYNHNAHSSTVCSYLCSLKSILTIRAAGE